MGWLNRTDKELCVSLADENSYNCCYRRRIIFHFGKNSKPMIMAPANVLAFACLMAGRSVNSTLVGRSVGGWVDCHFLQHIHHLVPQDSKKTSKLFVHEKLSIREHIVNREFEEQGLCVRKTVWESKIY